MRLRLCIGSAVIALCGACPTKQIPKENDAVFIGVTTEVSYCPVIESVAAIPLEAWVGATIDLEGTVKDGEASVQWEATSGSFSDPTALATKYRCRKLGEHMLTLTIEKDSFCEDSTELEVTCTASPLCGDDEVDEYEECDDGNTEPADGCSELCLFEVE